VKTLIQGIKLLKKTAISENNSARSIHHTAKEALKQGTKMLDYSAKKTNKLNDDLTKTNAKLTNATEKMFKATTKRDM
jgi:ribosome recycling factor